MKNNIEVEIRGPITNSKYEDIKNFFDKNATFKAKKERRLIDYTESVEKRTKDIRIRETNGIPEIVIKLGEWGGSESREEILVETKAGTFLNLIKVFGELGYKKGILCIRNSVVYDYKGIEFALVEVPNHSYYFEAEILTTTDDAESAEVLIREVCEELNLIPFSKEEFFDYVNRLNREANTLFDYESFKEEDFC